MVKLRIRTKPYDRLLQETIRKNRTYVSIGEAVVEIFKAPYANDVRFDGTRIYKGRKALM
ncbi:MAG: hypothetical protein IPH69_00240 [Bacteroidales bacterium]|nr:hypothetical protein [Bacteroidales bacterium]